MIYMGAGEAEAITAALLAAGAPRNRPVLVVENASLPASRRIALTLEELPQISRYGLTGPTLIMVGEVFAGALAAAAEPVRIAACKTA